MGKSGSYLLSLLPVALASWLWLFNPFADPIASKAIGLSDLNSSQRTNIQLASKSVHGTVVRPGEQFSFNTKVGPRTTSRGFLMARSYVGGESPLTLGGGICCLSSLLYQAALESGLTIKERVGHLRTMQTVPPGLDATVWYGASDLRFRNDTDSPIMISCWSDRTQLVVQILSSRFIDRSSRYAIRTNTLRQTKDQMLVEVFRSHGGKELLVSRDLYRLSR